MAKRIHIQEPFEYHYYVIGIASDAPIWKLCWATNQALDLALSKQEKETPTPQGHKPAEAVLATLFQSKEDRTQTSVLHYYEDQESVRDMEFTLFEANKSLTPKAAKPFRYFLLIKALQDVEPDLPDLIGKLNQSEIILSSVDISAIKNIKNTLL